MADQPVEEHRLERIVSREWATVVWPVTPRGERPLTEQPLTEQPLTDVFEGL